MPVDTTHKDYDASLDLWERCRDAVAGEITIHEKGVKYLPKLQEEKAAEYEARKGRAPFFNATWRTVSGIKGMIFRKDPVRELPSIVESYAENIDLSGRPLDMFAQDVTEEVLTVGRAGLLVDYPPMPLNDNGEPITVAQAEAMGLRPYISAYKAESIINWKEVRINNSLRPVLVVLREESSAVGDDEFDHGTVTRYRVLDLVNGEYRQRLFVKNQDGGDELISESFPKMRGKSLNYIPFVFLGVDDLSPSVDTPPMLDLVNMNLHHYRVGASYEHGCHFSALGAFFVFGTPPDENNPIYLGGGAANCIADPGGSAEFVSPRDGFPSLEKNLESKKSEMAVLGARMLESQKAAVEASDTLKQRVNGEHSATAAMANVLSMGFERALRIMADWAGAAGDIKYQLNTDYVPAGITAQELTALVQAWQSGAISRQVLFNNLKSGEVIDSDVTFDEEQERIKSEGVGLAT